jgi:tRNA uridine 5-carbamoylmethylation protein Kti12
MYFRSMRREIYLLSCEFNIPFIVLWVNTDSKVAYRRNEHRNLHENGNVTDESFLRIVKGFETPLNNNHLFDKFCIEINGNIPFGVEGYLIPLDVLRSYLFSLVWRLLNRKSLNSFLNLTKI